MLKVLPSGPSGIHNQVPCSPLSRGISERVFTQILQTVVPYKQDCALLGSAVGSVTKFQTLVHSTDRGCARLKIQWAIQAQVLHGTSINIDHETSHADVNPPGSPCHASSGRGLQRTCASP